jgi:antitoxin YobK
VRRLTPLGRCALLHGVAFLGGLIVMAVVPALGVLVWCPGTALAGLVLGSVGFAHCQRNGIGLGRFLVSGLAVALSALMAWVSALVILCGVLRFLVEEDGAKLFAVLWWPELPLFTTGVLAYYGLGPFRTRLGAIERARQLIVGQRELRVGGPAQPAQLDQAERRLGLRLPRSYREFLLGFGELRAPAIRFLGIGPTSDLDNPTVDDCVGVTLEGRESFGLPPSYIVCSVDADGQVVCLDTFAMRDDEALAILWNCETRAIARVVAPSFGDHLVDRLLEPSTSRGKQ